ncbi:TonB-dependent receptor [Catalinimonas niigatensis]|uniref:TonB-dependent receptor n=1 Tax=Catalinimonas niigatensis TaxID=1397264 RepID=UPI0026669D40|nr:TonB-dependent receptor [Catalinimonas niigatensis]WPP48646.1 TonB-dependent receptor [Catalinimonas niigatensis]
MKTVFIFLLSYTFLCTSLAQTTIQGSVRDAEANPLTGANVYLQHTYDGSSSDTLGYFSFETASAGEHILVISALGYASYQKKIIIDTEKLLFEVILQENTKAMESVTISSGAFEAGDSKKSVVLSAMDIVTTAGALGDISGALQTLPGTQTVGEDGRLFVRGGEGHEAQVFIDGMQAHTPFNASVPNLPTRGRFSPFLFKGITFSTGGYSAEYDQALSSALILNTKDKPEQTQTDISLMTVGTDITHQHAWETASLAVKGEYMNLAPYQFLVPQDIDMFKAPESVGGSLVGRKQTSATGMIKGYINYNYSELGVRQNNINHPGHKDSIYLINDNLYTNISYRESLGKKWSVQSGLSFTYDQKLTHINTERIQEKNQYWHAKTIFTFDASDLAAIRIGAEHMYQGTNQKYALNASSETVDHALKQNLNAVFAEGDLYLTHRIIIRPGLRANYAALQQQWNIAPRYSMAYKTNKDSQISMAYGQYHQQLPTQWLLLNSQLTSSRADHYILNYQYMQQGKTFRIEAYHKQYHKLIKYELDLNRNPVNLNNTGKGYARGLDIFWRDRKSIPNGDYWLSYSLLDTKRNYLHYPHAAVPGFVSRHNFSAVYKHFVTALRTQLGASYQWASSRPYHNPNQEAFQAGRTAAYHNLSINAAFLFKQNIIFYTSTSNVLGTRNIFGYEYANQPGIQGEYARQAIVQPASRFLFIGVFVTLTKNGQVNQLDQL